MAVATQARSAAAEDAEVKALVARSRGGDATFSDRDRIRLVTLTTEDYLGRGDTTRSRPGAIDESHAERDKIDVRVDVVWGDVIKVAADLYTVGHYRGVVPQRAELALDDAISKRGRSREAHGGTGGIIAAQTRRNGIRADVGDISYFPWADAEHTPVGSWPLPAWVRPGRSMPVTCAGW